jgi:hypothetical protein
MQIAIVSFSGRPVLAPAPGASEEQTMNSDTPEPSYKGSCLCGAVTFEVQGPLPAPTACHCTRCRKHTGHYEASVEIPRSHVTIHGSEHITWHRASEKARRGFCSTCGSSLFWDPTYKEWTGISMGAFDGPTHVKLAMHIFVADKGDYYDLADGVPQSTQ